jgi:anti-sigma regulatory factor (Ser/Thr protein kinase)
MVAELARHRLPATHEAPRDARALLAAQLRGAVTLEQRHVAELLVSELVTNALRHTESDVILVDVWTQGGIRVSVIDQSPRTPQRQSPGPERPEGRGLMIVDELAENWGIDALPGDGKSIWFELRRTPTAEHRSDGSSAQSGVMF